MASLYISEYAELPDQRGHIILVGKEPAIASQKVTIGGSSTQSDAFQKETKFVRLNCDVACSVLFGADPTATASHARLSAGSTEFFGITKGHKLAVITNS